MTSYASIFQEKACKWQKKNGEVDGLTTNGILILQPSLLMDEQAGAAAASVGPPAKYIWKEVSVDGDIYSLRETRSSSKRGDLVKGVTNELQVSSTVFPKLSIVSLHSLVLAVLSWSRVRISLQLRFSQFSRLFYNSGPFRRRRRLQSFLGRHPDRSVRGDAAVADGGGPGTDADAPRVGESAGRVERGQAAVPRQPEHPGHAQGQQEVPPGQSAPAGAQGKNELQRLLQRGPTAIRERSGTCNFNLFDYQSLVSLPAGLPLLRPRAGSPPLGPPAGVRGQSAQVPHLSAGVDLHPGPGHGHGARLPPRLRLPRLRLKSLRSRRLTQHRQVRSFVCFFVVQSPD